MSNVKEGSEGRKYEEKSGFLEGLSLGESDGRSG